MTVVPFVDPPVATLTRPFIIFFFRSMLGSSQLKPIVAVAENSLTFCGPGTLRDGIEEAGSIDGLAVGVEDNLRERNAPSRLAGALDRMVKLAGMFR